MTTALKIDKQPAARADIGTPVGERIGHLVLAAEPVDKVANGFASCDAPAGLQEICDRLQPGTIEVFAQRWLHRIPMPFGSRDRDAEY